MLQRDDDIKILREYIVDVLDEGHRQKLGLDWDYSPSIRNNPRKLAVRLTTDHMTQVLDYIRSDVQLSAFYKAYRASGLEGVEELREIELRLRSTASSLKTQDLNNSPIEETQKESEYPDPIPFPENPIESHDIRSIDSQGTSAEESIFNELSIENPEPTLDEKSAISSELRIPVDAIVVKDINVREIVEDSPEFLDLVNSIEQYGLLQPVVVASDGPNTWRLLAGERRYRAIRHLGWSTVPVRVVDADSEQWKAIMMTENLQRQDFTPWEEVLGYEQLLQTGLSLREVSRKVNKNPGYVSTLLKLMRNALIREAIHDGQLSTRTLAFQMASLLHPDGQEKYPGLVSETLQYIARERPTVAKLRDFITTHLDPLPTRTEDKPIERQKRESFLKREAQRLMTVRKTKAARFSSAEVSMLAELYEKTARELRDALNAQDDSSQD